MTKQELKNYLIEECEYSESRVNNMDSYELLDRYLRYEGIVGFTHDILKVVDAAFGTKLSI